MTIVSTDDAQVIELVRRLDNVTLVLRPAELADSDTSTDAVVHHALDSAAIDTDPIVLLLQPTSPFRNRSLIEDCIRAVANSPDSAALSVTRAAKDPAWIRCLGEHGRLLPGPIDCLPVVPTGAVYAFRCERFRRCGTLAGMNRIGVLSDVVHACDIDHEYELVMAQALAEAGFGHDIIDLAD
jgi:CMP-N-acetylneuraminic acid synthetase